jgi:CubicO group peptidase (beta-lactamase class C family)
VTIAWHLRTHPPILGRGDHEPDATAETLAKLSATIAGQYPSARALVLARGNCILHEYYANNSPDVQWPVHSATKSVLSTLVGIAIDKGFLPLDQKLPELVTQDWKLS